jgi:ZZ-type zinc finger-containing protein 3
MENEFFFESSHLALRSNPDYLKIMKHLAILCSQRTQVHSQIKMIENKRDEAISDPISFLENLKKGSIIFADVIEISEVIDVNISQSYYCFFSYFKSLKIPKIDFTKYGPDHIENDHGKNSSSPIKPHHTNLWSLDEQKKLEELLIEFPPESVESNRFKKIAAFLSNRTEKQVASRVQKFFKKLHEANLPIPGASCRLRSRNIKSQKKNLRLERPTTFFPERIIPKDVFMKDDTEDDDQLFAPKNIFDDQTKVLKLLKQIRDEKVKLSQTKTNFKYEFYCSACESNFTNLTTHKWSCLDCIIDFCCDCMTTQLLRKPSFKHLNHEIVSVQDQKH